MIKCLIIDDDSVSRMILKEFISKDKELELVKEFDNAVEAINFINTNEFDLLFLDIEMPEMTGIELLELLHKNIPQTIFTTSYTDFAINAFKFNVSGYLVKPFNLKDFSSAILKVKESISRAKPKPEKCIFIKQGSTIEKVNIADVAVIECIGDYVNLYANERKFTIHSTMKMMEKQFPDDEFLRVHRSYIVRIDKIEEIEDDSISYGKKIIPIGKTYKTQVYEKLRII